MRALTRQLHLLPAVLVALATVLVPAAATAAPQIDRDAISRVSQFVSGEAIVRFYRGTRSAERLAARRAAGVGLARALELPQAQVVEVDGSVLAAVERLERQPDIAYAQPNYRYRALAVAPPNDTFFDALWGLEDPAAPNPGVNALEAWVETLGGGEVVAVVDTGVALDHPDLVGNLWTNPDETPGGGDDDGNGRGDDVDGYDFVDGDTDPDDYNFHGTHVAGTIAATANNGQGIAGVAPAAKIMPVRVLDGDGSGSTADVADGIRYASREGADVINLSLGGPAGVSDLLMSDAVDEANTRDVVVVAAAGNDGSDNDATPTTPCTLPQPNLLCVAAVNQDGDRAGFSNYGQTTVDIGAPGKAILSTKTDYDQLGAAELFNADGIPGWNKIVVTPGSIQWGSSSIRSEGTLAAADSPGVSQDYAANSNTQLVRSSPVDLTGQRGCRMHFDLRYEIEDAVDENGFLFDSLFAGAIANGGLLDDGYEIAGDSNGLFEQTEVSVSDLDNRSDVLPAFALFSDALFQFDGAYVDNLRTLCRATTYSNEPPPAGNYVVFDGTSMATPHVAGVAALVRAAAPGASDTEVVEAIKSGGASLPSLVGETVTGCTVDAAGAIAVALGFSSPSGCASPPPPPPPSAPSSGSNVPPLLPPVVAQPARPDLRSAPLRIRVKRARFQYRFRAAPGLRGNALFRTRAKAVVPTRRGAVRRHLTLARPRFTVGSRGVVTLRVRLSRKQMRILRRNRRLALRVAVTLVDSAGRSTVARKRLALLTPRRR